MKPAKWVTVACFPDEKQVGILLRNPRVSESRIPLKSLRKLVYGFNPSSAG